MRSAQHKHSRNGRICYGRCLSVCPSHGGIVSKQLNGSSRPGFGTEATPPPNVSTLVAKRGGCFQRRLFVCQCDCVCLSVCPHDNFRTTKRRTIKLGDQVHCIKVSHEFEGQGQKSKVKVTRDKKRKIAESSPLTMHSRACDVARPYATNSNRRYRCMAARR